MDYLNKIGYLAIESIFMIQNTGNSTLAFLLIFTVSTTVVCGTQNTYIRTNYGLCATDHGK